MSEMSVCCKGSEIKQTLKCTTIHIPFLKNAPSENNLDFFSYNKLAFTVASILL